jgi:LemA protein
MVTWIVLVMVGIGLVSLIIGIYNGLVSVRNNVEKSWSNIDVVLEQRHDELPKLIDACKGYMAHERDLLTKITELRTGYASANDSGEKINIENELNRRLGQLRMVWERYPDLKASENFSQIMDRVSAVESKIADYREAFNDAVNIYNIQIERFPDLVFAKAMNYQRRSFLEVLEEKKADVRMAFA